MKTLTGYLTNTDKKAIKAILSIGKNSGRVGKSDYFLTSLNGVYTCIKVVKDRGLIPCPGSKLRISQYKSTFKI